MRIDLFEFLEGVFRGLVYFFYNAVETLWILALHPWRGGSWLYRAYTQKGRQQIGGLTFLFLIFFIFFGLFTQAFTNNGVDLAAMARTPFKLDSEDAWRSVLSAAVSTVLLDSMGRLYFRWRVPKHARRRRRLLAQLEYALTWPVLFLLLAPLIALLMIGTEGFNGLAALVFSAPVGMLLSLGATAPAAAALRMKPHPRRRRVKRSRWQWFGFIAGRLAVQLGILLIIVAAALAGSLTRSALATPFAPPDPKAEPFAGTLDPVALRCTIEGESLLIELVLHNRTSAPVLFDPTLDARLHVTRGPEEDFGGLAMRLLDSQGSALIQPHQGAVFQLAAIDPKVETMRKGSTCDVISRQGERRVWIAEFKAVEIGGTKP